MALTPRASVFVVVVAGRLVVVLALALGAVGHPTAPARSTPADQALASSTVLKLNDFPLGWREGPGSKMANYAKYGAVCSQVAGTQRAAIAHASSSNFSRDNEQVSNGALVFKTPAAATSVLTLVQTSRTQACLTKVTQATIAVARQSGISVTSTSFGRLSVAPLGELTVGYELVIGAAKDGINVNAYFDLIFTKVGRVGIGFTSSNTGTSPSADVTATIRAAVSRAATAQGMASTAPLTSGPQ